MSRARLLTPLAALALLAGCGMPNPAAASQVGDVTIAEKTVTSLTEACAPVVHRGVAEMRTTVVEFLTRGEAARQLAAKHGIDVSEGAIDAALPQIAPDQFPLLNTGCAPLVRSSMATEIVANQLQATFLPEAHSLGITLNPRYGTWDATKLTTAGSGSLSTIAGG